jgi:hypothetical protein
MRATSSSPISTLRRRSVPASDGNIYAGFEKQVEASLGQIPRETAIECRALEAIRLDELYARAFEWVKKGV